MSGNTLQLDDDASERQFWGKVLPVVWTVLTVLVVAGVLVLLTVTLRWTPHLLLCTLGLLAGASLSLALLGSVRSRERTGLVLGAIVFPMLAVWLTGLAATSSDAYFAYSAAFIPFIVHAGAVVAGGSAIAGIWRKQPGQRSAVQAAGNQVQDKGAMP